MNWDEVEREFFVIGSQLHRLGESFRALAAALRRERENLTLDPTRVMRQSKKTNKDGAPEDQASLF